MVAGAALAGGGTAALLWPEPRVAAEVGSVIAAPTGLSPAVGLAVPQVPTVPPSPSTLSPSGFVPQRLLVERLEIDAPLIATLVDSGGALVPPENPAQLAWWRAARPGEGAGSVVVAGHLDMQGYGQGPLARIVRLKIGDRAVLTGTDGASATYVLRGVTTINKQALPDAKLFGSDGPERLILVTCGGNYDQDRRSCDSNVVAILDPVPAG